MIGQAFFVAIALVQFMSALSFAQVSAHAFLWTAQTGMRDLGTLQGWQNSYALGLNQHGDIVGYNGDADGDVIAFAWTPLLGMHRLEGLSPTASGAVAINSEGQIAANSLLDAFLWTKKSGPFDLGNLGGGDTGATAINSSGDIVGSSVTSERLSHAFVWTAQSGIQDLMALVKDKSCPTCQSIAYGINDTGVIVGAMGAEGLSYQWPIVYRNGNIINLGDLGGTGRTKGGVAMAINNSGGVVGSAFAADGLSHPFLWTNSQGMMDLGLLPGAQGCYAYGVNETSQVVGYCEVSQAQRAFLWTASTGLQDLGTLPGGSQARAYAINNAGLIVGWSDTQ